MLKNSSFSFQLVTIIWISFFRFFFSYKWLPNIDSSKHVLISFIYEMQVLNLFLLTIFFFFYLSFSLFLLLLLSWFMWIKIETQKLTYVWTSLIVKIHISWYCHAIFLFILFVYFLICFCCWKANCINALSDLWRSQSAHNETHSSSYDPITYYNNK